LHSCREKTPKCILAVRVPDATSAHFWKFAYSDLAMSPLEIRLLTVLETNKSKEGVLDTCAMTITDESAVNNAIWNLRSKVDKHIQMIGRSKFRKPP
jgi:hypothetical protein